MFKKVGVFIVLKFWTCGYKSASSASLWLMNKGSSVGILRFRNCRRTCAVAVPSVFSSIFRDWFPWRTLAVVQILHYLTCRPISFQECELVGGLGLFTKCVSVCMYVYTYRATIHNQHKTGHIYMLEKGFENPRTCSICCFYKTYELRKRFYAFTW